MSFSQCFTPQVNTQTEIVILGSMPGLKSLEQAEYYAHPRNAFWPIMQRIFGINILCDYQRRLQQLNQQQLGLWDVYASCFRHGSLDSAIEKKTAQINDFESLLGCYSNIKAIFFNGKAAEKAFIHHYKAAMEQGFLQSIQFKALPSTSPAHAAMSVDDKLLLWQQAINEV